MLDKARDNASPSAGRAVEIRCQNDDFSAIRSSYVEAAYSKTFQGENARTEKAAGPAPKDFSQMVGDAAAQAVESRTQRRPRWRSRG